jgi:hypothetical protein
MDRFAVWGKSKFESVKLTPVDFAARLKEKMTKQPE